MCKNSYCTYPADNPDSALGFDFDTLAEYEEQAAQIPPEHDLTHWKMECSGPSSALFEHLAIGPGDLEVWFASLEQLYLYECVSAAYLYDQGVSIAEIPNYLDEINVEGNDPEEIAREYLESAESFPEHLHSYFDFKAYGEDLTQEMAEITFDGVTYFLIGEVPQPVNA